MPLSPPVGDHAAVAAGTIPLVRCSVPKTKRPELSVSFRGAPVPPSTGELADAASAVDAEDHLASLWFSYGWNKATVLVHALSTCGASCTNSQLISEVEKTADFTPPGDSTFGSVSYSSSKHYATTSVQFYTWDPAREAEKPILDPITLD